MNESLIEEELTKKIIGAAIEVHRYWGSSVSSCNSKLITPPCLGASVVKLSGSESQAIPRLGGN
jgi:hypothetical protein